MTSRPATRKEATAEADAYLDRLEQALASSGRAMVRLAGGHLPLLRVIRSHLRQAIADRLQRGAGAGPLAAIDAFARGRLYELKETLDALRRRSPGFGGEPGVRVLAVPRTRTHIRHQELVAHAGAISSGPGPAKPDHPTSLAFGSLRAPLAKSLTFAWLTFRSTHAAAVSSPRVALAPALAAPSPLEALRLRAELAAALFGARGEVPAAVRSTVHREGQAQIASVLTAIAAIERLVAAFAPNVILAGNPCTTEGLLATAIARARGIPCAAMQHGVIVPDRGEWSGVLVDRFFVWGDEPKEALIASGLDPDRVVVTGAPWVDAIHPRPERSASGRILVALSGAGHAVGREEHEGHVRRLYEASTKLGGRELLFRLHPKDDPAIYRRIAAEVPGARATVEEASEARGDIHEALEAASLLVTVTSASAMDAMLHDVPVVTLGRTAGERVPSFVEAGATLHAAPSDDLAAVLARGLSCDTDDAARIRARAYVDRYFGPRDGAAAVRVAEGIADLARGSA